MLGLSAFMGICPCPVIRFALDQKCAFMPPSSTCSRSSIASLAETCLSTLSGHLNSIPGLVPTIKTRFSVLWNHVVARVQ